MSATAQAAQGLPGVRTQINYLVPMAGKPTTYVSEPPPGVARLNATYAPRDAWIRDARPIRSRLSLEREGFVLADHVSATRDFWDDAEVRTVYYPEIERLVRALTGATEAVAFDHTRRRRTADRAALSGNRLTFSEVREPVGKAHTDFTPRSAFARLKLELGRRSEQVTHRRFAIINVWRPLNAEPIFDAPLAMLDAGSFAAQQLVASDLVYADRVGETYNLTHGSEHRWYYFARQSRNEAVVFKNFDSDSPAPFAPHTAFDDPNAPSDAPSRESIEARLFVLF
jgi:hypothetical protein